MPSRMDLFAGCSVRGEGYGVKLSLLGGGLGWAGFDCWNSRKEEGKKKERKRPKLSNAKMPLQ